MDNLIPVFVDGHLRPMDKLDAHRKGLRHLAISVFVTRGDHILLQQRALTKYHTPGLWANTCCTHPYWGETAIACATRRLDEELGLSGLTLHHAGMVEYRADVAPDMIEHEVVDIFTATAPSGIEPVPNPDEVAATEWISHAALRHALIATPERFTPWLRIYMERHALMIFGATTAA